MPYRRCLILRGPLDVVDDQDLDRGLDEFQFEAKLILDRSEKRWGGVRLCVGGGLCRGEVQGVVVVANEACAVDDWAAELLRERVEQYSNGGGVAGDLTATDV